MTRRQGTLAIATATLVMFAAIACGDAVKPSVSPPTIESVTPSGQGVASPPANEGFGPLAMIRPGDGTDSALNTGTLRVTEHCVLLETPSGLELLVWPADRTMWDPDTRQVAFTNFDGTIVRAGNGTRVRVGGGGSSNEEDSMTSEVWLSQMPWVQRPADSCPLATRWFVGGLELEPS